MSFDLGTLTFDYAATEAALVENTAQGTTDVMLTLTSATLPVQNLTVTLNATGVAWSDIAFVNGTPPTLVPPVVS